MARRKNMDLLTQDARAARAANMSYGKWRAMRWLKGDIEEIQAPEKPEGMKACPWCGTLFKPNRNQQYCDIMCQRQAQEERKKAYAGA